ncbi:MAG: GNAT family N-acetyltransferase [Planctomycetota bacterium]
MDNELQFRKFEEADFSEYRRWYQVDDRLNEFLGPMEENDEWLEAVLNPDPEDETWSAWWIESGREVLVAVVNISVNEAGCTIAAIATCPEQRGRGFGHATLSHLAAKFGRLIVHVEEENSRALEFFADHGFVRLGECDEMITLEYLEKQ